MNQLYHSPLLDSYSAPLVRETVIRELSARDMTRQPVVIEQLDSLAKQGVRVDKITLSKEGQALQQAMQQTQDASGENNAANSTTSNQGTASPPAMSYQQRALHEYLAVASANPR